MIFLRLRNYCALCLRLCETVYDEINMKPTTTMRMNITSRFLKIDLKRMRFLSLMEDGDGVSPVISFLTV